MLTGKHLCLRLFLIKFKNFIKEGLQHWCFHVNFTKFLKTSILKNICEQLPLSRWPPYSFERLGSFNPTYINNNNNNCNHNFYSNYNNSNLLSISKQGRFFIPKIKITLKIFLYVFTSTKYLLVWMQTPSSYGLLYEDDH